MFDLEKEIDAWCRSVRSNGGQRAASDSELKDHVYCIVDQFLEEGRSEEQAFLAATQRMGNVEELRLEFAKNRGFVLTLSDLLSTKSRTASGGADMSKSKPLLPTITSAFGMLLGGLLGAAGGAYSGSELIVVVGYISGFLGGAIVGAMLGWRWHARRNRDEAHSQ